LAAAGEATGSLAAAAAAAAAKIAAMMIAWKDFMVDYRRVVVGDVVLTTMLLDNEWMCWQVNAAKNSNITSTRRTSNKFGCKELNLLRRN
jgi:hypothetical protein